MGISCDAIMYFGFDIYGDEAAEDEYPPLPAWATRDDDGDNGLWEWEDEYVRRHGAVRPDDANYNSMGWKDYWVDRRVLLDAATCGIGFHGAPEFSTGFVYAYKERAYLGEAKDIDAEPLLYDVLSPAVYTPLALKLKDFCEELDIVWQQPTWRLASYYSY